jgi:hypothetical protein
MRDMEDGSPGYQEVCFSAAAKAAWVSWWDAHAAEMRGPELPAVLLAPWGKLKTYAARLALVLHHLWLAETGEDERDLDAATLERAFTLIEYFKGHLRRVYARLRQTAEEKHLLEVLDWVRREMGGRCTVRELMRARKVVPAASAKKLLEEFVAREYGRFEEAVAANRKTVRTFVCDPS